MKLFATGHGQHVNVKSAKYSRFPRIGVRIYTNFGPVHGGLLNNGGRVRIVSGEPSSFTTGFLRLLVDSERVSNPGNGKSLQTCPTGRTRPARRAWRLK